MDRINKITSRIWVSGDPCYSTDLQADLDAIYEHDMVVIDCRSIGERFDGWDELVEGQPTVYVNLNDDGRANSIVPFQNLELELRQRKLMDRNLMVHCHMGVNRAPSVAMFLMMLAGTSPVAAFRRIRRNRTGAGIAYARQAVEAASAGPEAARVNGANFAAWEHRYWKTETFKSVNDAILANRERIGERGGTWIDSNGLIHGVNTR